MNLPKLHKSHLSASRSWKKAETMAARDATTRWDLEQSLYTCICMSNISCDAPSKYVSHAASG